MKREILFSKKIQIEKGQQSNKLTLLRELMRGMEDLFHVVKTTPVSWFDLNQKTVAKKSFKATLIIEELD